jgi:hypothetical protein
MSPEFPHYGRLNIEMIAAKALDIVLENGTHSPTLIVNGSKENTVLVMDTFALTHALRMQQMAMFGFAFGLSGRTGKLQQVFLISEAWMSSAKEGQLPSVSPSEDPERKEILIIVSLNLIEDAREATVFEMVRDSEAVLRELKNFLSDDKPQLSSESPLLDAFVIGFQIGSGEIG